MKYNFEQTQLSSVEKKAILKFINFHNMIVPKRLALCLLTVDEKFWNKSDAILAYLEDNYISGNSWPEIWQDICKSIWLESNAIKKLGEYISSEDEFDEQICMIQKANQFITNQISKEIIK